MKKSCLLYYLFIFVSMFEAVKAQDPLTRSKVMIILVKDAVRHIGNIVKLNCERYKTADDGKTLIIYMNTKRSEKSLMLMLTGKSRKTILAEMHIRRQLNREIKQPLDTSITATGKIVLYNGRLRLLIRHPSDVYLGADLQIEQP